MPINKIKRTTSLSLPRLSNAEFDRVQAHARKSGIPLSQCPTCLSTQIEVSDGVWGWENGDYNYLGQSHKCECEVQMTLRKHYVLANIPDQYQRLNWADFRGEPKVGEVVALYLEKWNAAKLNGMGLEFFSPTLGSGKTMAATYIGKELIKRGEKVLFVRFSEVINALTHGEDESSPLYDATVLILDEVIPATTIKMADLFARQFESLIRTRTDFNRPTLMTTNLTPEELNRNYPRTYSLLEAKQIRVEMKNDDARQGWIANQNLELLANDEVRPIT